MRNAHQRVYRGKLELLTLIPLRFWKGQSEWGRLVDEWRPVRDEWNEAINRITLAFAGTENPSQEDLDLEEILRERCDEIEARMDQFRLKLLRRGD